MTDTFSWSALFVLGFLFFSHQVDPLSILYFPNIPTHPDFAGDTQILQHSPTHPREADHPHLTKAKRQAMQASTFPTVGFASSHSQTPGNETNVSIHSHVRS